MERRERCYRVTAGKGDGKLRQAALAALVLEVNSYLSAINENVQVEIDEGKNDGAAGEVRLRVTGNIISDEIVDSAVRLGVIMAGVAATRIGKA